MATSATENYSAIVAIRTRKASIDTTTFFSKTQIEADLSPIDQFLKNSLGLNQHWAKLKDEEDISPELGILLLLGYVSAVEGFMRFLLRKLIHVDPFAQNICETFQVSYAAVLHHESKTLPDSLLEETVFSSGKSISTSLNKFIGFTNFTSSTQRLIEEYESICQLRHCCTHRFGRLGAKNAQALGLSTHAKFLEKPIVIGKKTVEDIADLLFALTKSINNEVFGFILKRSATGQLPSKTSIGIGWTWKEDKDAAQFQKYYDIFASTHDATPSLPAKDQYEMFRSALSMVGTKPTKSR